MPKKPLIRYTNRDFQSIKNDLVEYTKRYYSNTFKDFNEASFGSLMLDTVAYVGDLLSFYLDYQVNESFLDSAIEYDNVVRHGSQVGYKFRQNASSFGVIDMYLMVPAVSSGVGPDRSYMPILKQGTEFSSNDGGAYTLNENVDFGSPEHEVVVSTVNSTTGVPTHYAVRARGQIVSGRLEREVMEIASFQKFLKVVLSEANITEIVSVYDTEGHRYYEVDFLSQNVIYMPVTNHNEKERQYAPSLLKPVPVARRFIVVQQRNETFLQFGHGSDSEIFNDSVVDPSKIIMNMHGREFITDDSFDPSNLVATDKFGIAPSNTSLVITYRRNTSADSNATVNSINNVARSFFEFPNRSKLDSSKMSDVRNSLEVSNENKMVGDILPPNIEELKMRIRDHYAAQNRAVTKQDYMSVIYNMPSQFGAIKKANIIQDNDSFKRNLNIYVVSQTKAGKLTKTNNSIKENLKIWLNRHKMINDTVDILDARIVNFGINFEIIVASEANRFAILERATNALRRKYDKSYNIGEPIQITDMYKTLNLVEGVVDTIRVNVVNKSGGVHSEILFPTDFYLSADGRRLLIPNDHIFELKFPRDDIRGAIH
jgi:hypothetical protein